MIGPYALTVPGIAGVVGGGLLSGLYDVLNNNPNLAKSVGNAVSSLGGGTSGTGGTSGLGTGAGGGLAAVVRGNQSPFSFGQQTPIQGTTTSAQPTYLGELGQAALNQKIASLLKG